MKHSNTLTAIVTMAELKQLEQTVRAAADLSGITTVGGEVPEGELDLDDAKLGENGYLLDDELYNSLKR